MREINQLKTPNLLLISLILSIVNLLNRGLCTKVVRKSLQGENDQIMVNSTASENPDIENQKEILQLVQSQFLPKLHTFHKLRRNRRHHGRRKTSRRSFSNMLVEIASCEHIELIDCEEYVPSDIRCWIAATGMPCCLCSGELKSLLHKRRRHWRRKIAEPHSSMVGTPTKPPMILDIVATTGKMNSSTNQIIQ